MRIDEIIKYIAQCDGVSEEEVIKDMQDALDIAYQNHSNDTVKFHQKTHSSGEGNPHARRIYQVCC